MFALAISSLVVVTLATVTASFCFVDPLGLAVWVVPVTVMWIMVVPNCESIPLRDLKKCRALIGICLVLTFSTLFVQWPLRVAFWLSQGSCETLAARIVAGEKVEMPRRAGVMLIKEAGINNRGMLFLWTDPGLGGPIGVTKCGTDEVERGFNLWFTFSLSNDWQFVSED